MWSPRILRICLLLVAIGSLEVSAIWNPFGKDGIITKIVESAPGGGWVTAPFHAAAGNNAHAVQAAIAGFGTAAAAVASGGTSIVPLMIAGGASGITSVFNSMQLSQERRDAAVRAEEAGNHVQAANIFLEATNNALRESTRELSAASGGRRILKSEFGTYLRAYKDENKLDLKDGHANAWEHWYVEDWKGKVVFKAIHSPGKFLRAWPDGHVDMTFAHPRNWEMWKPFKNHDGSWSFLSHHGSWLSLRGDASVTTASRCLSSERVWLEWW